MYAGYSRYDGIFNIVNSDDMITGFPFDEWGFTRYGQTASFSIKDDYENQWNSLTGKDYQSIDSVDDAFKGFLDEVVSRNSCYEASIAQRYRVNRYKENDGVIYDIFDSYPDCVKSSCIVDNQYIYQKPEFLLNYFAAVASNSASPFDFICLDVARYLENAKKDLLVELGVDIDWVIGIFVELELDDIIALVQQGNVSLGYQYIAGYKNLIYASAATIEIIQSTVTAVYNQINHSHNQLTYVIIADQITAIG